MTRVHAVIPAAGRGVRFGSSDNKVFQPLRGRSVIQWSVDAFRDTADRVTVVAGDADFARLVELFPDDSVEVALGAQTRQESVFNGLKTVEGDDTIVLVHDGARPLVSQELILRCIASAEQHGSGVAALPVLDALKRSRRDVTEHSIISADIDRADVWAAQTPQAFRLNLLLKAHQSALDTGYNGLDESSLVQRLPDGLVHLVQGDRKNIKITTHDDLRFAELLTSSSMFAETRVGLGYDIHRLVQGRDLWLGGVKIPSQLGLDGHSDADVLLHAVCDSLLGAAGLPDIGHFFPNTDPQYRGISSLKLLEQVRSTIGEAGWSVGNIDSMLIAEQPKIASYIEQMKDGMSSVLKTSRDRLSIKATTNEGIGSLGASEGIACHATSTIFRSR